MPDQTLRTALTRVGRTLAAHSRSEQGLPLQVEDAEAIAGFVELWQSPRPYRALKEE